MLLYLITLLLFSTLLGFILAVPLINLLYKFNITRRGESDFATLIEKRKLKIGVPVMGGILVVIVVIVLNLAFNLDQTTLVVLSVFALSALLGAFDDVLNIYGHKRRVRTMQKINTLIRVHAKKLVRLRLIITYPWHLYSRFFFMLGSNPGKGIHAHEKILVQGVAGLILAVWVWSQSTMSGYLWVPFLGSINIGLFMIPFVLITVLLMTNAVNLADGLDGLSSTQLISSFVGFTIIALDKEQYNIAVLLITTIGALLAYLYFNIPPARVQMGDVGSLSLGALLAAVAFVLEVPLLLLLISLPFAVTLTSSVVQGLGRRILGRRIFKMAPIHHHFELLGWSEEKIVMRFALFSILCMIVGVWIYYLDKFYVLFV